MNEKSTRMFRNCFALVVILSVSILHAQVESDINIYNITLAVNEFQLDGIFDRYDFYARVQGSNITQVRMTTPNGVDYFLHFEEEYPFELDASGYSTLGALRADFPTGNYTFTFNGGTDSVTVFHDPPQPTGFANITYPVHGSTDVPVEPTFTWDDCTSYGASLYMELEDEEGGGLFLKEHFADIALTSWTPPVTLDFEHEYRMGIGVHGTTGPEILTRLYVDDEYEYYSLFERFNEVFFTTESPVVEDNLDIDWIGMTSCKQFRDGVPQGPNPWSLDIWVRVVEPGALDHIDVTKPGEASPFVTMYEGDISGWWVCSLDDDYASLDDLRLVYQEGIYTLDLLNSEDGLIKSLDIAYDDLPDEPIEPVDFIYPSENGQTGISVNPTFTWEVNPAAADASMRVVENEEIVYLESPVSISSTSWTPGSLLYGYEYELDVSVMNIKDWAGGPGFPTTTDSTGDTFSYSYMIEYLNEIVFTTLPLDDPIERIEEILDFVDEAVEAGTLTGNGPGNSAGNRLNAIRNKLEAASDLIEEGQYEEACDHLWSIYRKCDSDSQPPDFVTGEAVDELADMILIAMDELGCE